MAPKYVLVANDNDDPDKLKAAMDEKEKELQDAKAKIAKLEADHAEDPHAPETRDLKSAIKAILKAMDDDEHENMKGMDEEHKKEAKASIQKAMEVFEEGNGEQVDNKTQVGNQGEPSTKVTEAKIAKLIAKEVGPLEAKVKLPLINKILTAKTLKGATEDDIKTETVRLEKMSLKAVEEEFNSNKIFIEDALTASEQETDSQALIAKEEGAFEFNGVHPTGLTGNTVSIDEALEKVVA